MPTNYLTQFATSGTANLPTEATWQNLTERATGFQTGLARSSYFNRLFAQGANAAYVLGEFVVDYASADADLDGANLYTNFKTALSGYIGGSFLPKSGGAMTGAITRQGIVVQPATDSTYTQFHGGSTSTTGATFILTGKDNTYYGGGFVATARDGTYAKSLQGLPDGTLKWANVEVERTHNTSGKYLKLDSGVLVCWGIVQTTSSGVDIAFGDSFKDNNEPVVFTCAQNTSTTTSYSSRTASGFNLKANSSSNVWVSWLAVGRWK